MIVSARIGRLRAIVSAHDVVLDEEELLEERMKLVKAEKLALELAYNTVKEKGDDEIALLDRGKNFTCL